MEATVPGGILVIHVYAESPHTLWRNKHKHLKSKHFRPSNWRFSNDIIHMNSRSWFAEWMENC